MSSAPDKDCECLADKSYRATFGHRFSGSGPAGSGLKPGNSPSNAPPVSAPSGGIHTVPTGGINIVPTGIRGQSSGGPSTLPVGGVLTGGGAASAVTKTMKMSQSGALNTLHAIREPIVEYQEGRGVPRSEIISFVTLVTSLCTHAYTAGITILVMLWNLAPLLDGFVYFARFMVDKLIEIFETEDKKDQTIKAAVFLGEIIVILFIIFLIMGLIFMPVYVLTARIVGKIWGMIAW